MTLLRPFVIVLLAMGIVACGQQAPSGAAGAAPPPPVPTSSTSLTTSPPPDGFGATERAFVQLAIATNDQAVKLLDLGATRATEPLLRDLAKDMAATRRTELAALHDLLTSASVRYRNLHAGHDMPGMPTDAELGALGAAGGFDAGFTRLARAHLVESRTVARSAAEHVGHPGTRSVAEAMVDERASSLARLDELG